MAEVIGVPKIEAPKIEVRPAVAEPKKQIGQHEAEMAGIAARRENPDLAFSLLAGERGEKPIISPETRQRNYDTVRSGFLHIDREGRCNPGGACTETFQELVNLSGDNHAWTKEDMKKQEIIDLTMAYRTFGTLYDNKPLIPEEQAVLQKLLDRQEEINTKTDETIRNNVSIGNLNEQNTRATTITRNQEELNQLSRALREGINTEAYHIITPGSTRAQWANELTLLI